jgi:hypothetical protein
MVDIGEYASTLDVRTLTLLFRMSGNMDALYNRLEKMDKDLGKLQEEVESLHYKLNGRK